MCEFALPGAGTSLADAPAPPGLWSAVDTAQAPYALICQWNLAGDDLEAGLATLDAVARLLNDHGLRAGFGEPGDHPAGTYLFGASVRLTKGTWSSWRDDDDFSARWGHEVVNPRSLRTMQAKRDSDFPAFAGQAQRDSHETDVILLLEAADAGLLEQVLARLAATVAGLRTHRGALRAEGRDPFGFRDGVSNLQDLRRHEPDRYAGHVLHDEPDVPEGSYLVFRKYRLFPERLRPGATVTVDDPRNGSSRTLTGEQIVGRCRPCAAVLTPDGEHLPTAYDEGQGAGAPAQSHLHKANPRGYGHTNFGHDVVVPPARVLRRSYPFADGDGDGLLFLAFQADIQDGGFEFIHNEWLLSDFNGAPDPLLTPEAGLVEPLTGCYYYVPRDQDRVAGILRALIRPPRPSTEVPYP